MCVCVLHVCVCARVRDFHSVLQEQELYQSEGLGLTEVKYTDNQDCIGGFALSCHLKSVSYAEHLEYA